MFTTLRDFLFINYLFIFYYLFRLKFVSSTTFGKLLRYNLIRLGPIGIKIGQLLSHRIDYLHPDICKLLTKLTSDIPDISNDEEINHDISILNEYPHWEKLGSGCIANTYIIRLNKEQYVIKIKKKNISGKISDSIKRIHNILIIFKFLRIDTLVSDFILKLDKCFDSLIRQSNFKYELKELNYFYNNYNNKGIVIPKPYDEFSNDSIIVMEYLEGRSFEELNQKEKSFYANELWNFAFNSAFIKGHWHSDLHKGNIVLMKNKLGIIDFGLTGLFSKLERITILNYSVSLIKRNFLQAAHIYVNKMTLTIKHIEYTKSYFIYEISEILKKYYSDFKNPNIFASVKEMSNVSKKYGKKFGEKFVEFELAFATLMNTMIEISNISIFEYLHQSIST